MYFKIIPFNQKKGVISIKRLWKRHDFCQKIDFCQGLQQKCYFCQKIAEKKISCWKIMKNKLFLSNDHGKALSVLGLRKKASISIKKLQKKKAWFSLYDRVLKKKKRWIYRPKTTEKYNFCLKIFLNMRIFLKILLNTWISSKNCKKYANFIDKLMKKLKFC